MLSKTQALFYDRSSGVADVVTFDRDGSIVHVRTHEGWHRGWDRFVVGKFLRGQPHLQQALLYDRDSGAAALATFDFAGHFALGTRMQFRRSWDVIVADPFVEQSVSGGQSQVFLYDRSAGEAAIVGFQSAHDVDAGHAGFRKSWDIAVSGHFAHGFHGKQSKNQIFLYDRGAGVAHVLAFDAGGGIQCVRQRDRFRRSWHRIASGTFLGEEHHQALLYDRNDGAMTIVDFAGDGTPLCDFPTITGLPSCDVLLTGRFFEADRCLALLYDRASGASLFARFDHSGAFHTRRVHAGWRTSWDVVATLPGRERDKVLLYDRAYGDVSVLSFDASGNFAETTTSNLRRSWSEIVPLGPVMA